MKRLKGQFFVLGAILIVGLFFIGLPKSDPLTYTRSGDLVYIFGNIEREFPIALNLGLNESNHIDTLKNFTWFTDRVMDEHLINFTALWLITEATNTSSDDLNITIFNYLGHNIIYNLSVCNADGTPSCSLGINIPLDNNSTNSWYYGPGFFTDLLNITLEFESNTVNLDLIQKDKVNFYAFISLERNENIIRGEVTG